MHENCAVIPLRRPYGTVQSVKKAVCMAITFVAMLVIMVLAVPACILVLSISAVWNLADRAIRVLE